MKYPKYGFNRVAPYLTGSDYLTVYTGRTSRRLYRFNPDLSNDDREVVLSELRFGESSKAIAAFLACGDLLEVKAKS